MYKVYIKRFTLDTFDISVVSTYDVGFIRTNENISNLFTGFRKIDYISNFTILT